MWTDNIDFPSGLKLLRDEISTDVEEPDIFEQATVADSLSRVIASELVRLDSSDFIIGFFGRYGQGKSKVVNEIVERFDRRRVFSNGKNVFSHCEIFAVSNYKAQDLEENFDFFLEGRRITSVLILTIFVLGSIFAFALTIVEALQIENRIQLTVLITLVGASLASLGALVGSFRLLWRDFSRSLRIGQLRFFFSSRLRAYWRGPKLLIVDDLDRATPEQQSALLQSLRRHRGSLNSVVLVAFNDEPLKGESDLRIHNTEEVFQKTFDAQMRLGPMTASDAAEMAYFFLSTLKRLNTPSSKVTIQNLAEVLVSPVLVGDVARVLYLHGNASARFAKKMLNSILLEAERLRLTSVHDISALIRVQGLLSYFPTLESDLDFLGVALNAQSTDELLSTVEERLSGELSDQKRRIIGRYLRYTNHMRPSHGTWKRVLRIWRNLKESEADFSPHFFPTEITKNWAMSDALLVATDFDIERRELYKDLMLNPLVRPRDRQLPSAPEFPDESDENPNSPEYSSLWRYLVLRVELYDEDLYDYYPAGALFHKIETYEKLDISVAPPVAVRLKNHLWTSPAGIIEHHSRLASKDLRLEDSLRQCLSSVNFLEPESRLLRPNVRNLRNLLTPLKRAWPFFGFQGQAISKDANGHFDRLLEVAMMYRDVDQVLPAAHRVFLGNIDSDCDSGVFSILATLTVSDGDLQFWPIGTVLEALQDNAVREKLRSDLLKSFLDADPKRVIWFAAIYFLATQSPDVELDENLAIVSSSKLSMDDNLRNSRWLQDVQSAGDFSVVCESIWRNSG